MSGVGFSEFLILCLIGLIVLGPKRLPQVASQIGSWVGQARRMTRVMKRQLEEELDFDKELNFKPTIQQTPNDDDSYSPLHNQPPGTVAGAETDESDEAQEAGEPSADDDTSDETPSESDDSEQQRDA